MGCNGICLALGGVDGVLDVEILPSVGGLTGLWCQTGLFDALGVGDLVQTESDWCLRLVLKGVQSSSF